MSEISPYADVDPDGGSYLDGSSDPDAQSDSVLFQGRNIGGFIADVTVEEEHTDDLTITEHPVEYGASITDHAYKMPARLVVRAGWSNASTQATDDDYVREVYANFLALQATREPFDVSTGKRQYTNMLIQSLSITTTVETESSLQMSVAMREVIIVQTQSATPPNAGNMADPSKTLDVQSGGVRQPVPVSSDIPGVGDDDGDI